MRNVKYIVCEIANCNLAPIQTEMIAVFCGGFRVFGDLYFNVRISESVRLYEQSNGLLVLLFILV